MDSIERDGKPPRSYLRQRKDRRGKTGYSLPRMNANLVLSEINVAELLKSTPKAARFFISQKTACVGCFLSKFCTLQDVVDAYQLDEKKFVEELSKLDVPNP